MNRTAKIVLLVLAILVAVGGVMAFYKTIVSPPGKLDFKNQFAESTKKDVEGAKSAKADYSLDSTYTAVTHEIQFQELNGLLTNEEGDELLKSFVINYVPAYVENCNNKFQQSVWYDDALKRIRAHIVEIHALKSSDGTKVVEGEANISLNGVDQTISNYYAAKVAASVGGYSSLADSQSKISTARKYLNMSPINNCTDLVSRLNSVASRLESAHYAYLSGQVERLRNYRAYTQDSYDALALSVSAKLKEYKNNANRVYGKVSNVSALENRANTYYDNANFDE